MLDAADTIEELTDQLRTLHETRDHLEAIISNLRAKLHHLQMVDSGE
jgi:cell division protein FtsB